jgi:RNA recognition motif-containing protein
LIFKVVGFYGLPKDATKKEMRDLLSKYGKIQNFKLYEKGVCFVNLNF